MSEDQFVGESNSLEIKDNLDYKTSRTKRGRSKLSRKDAHGMNAEVFMLSVWVLKNSSLQKNVCPFSHACIIS